MRIVRRAVLRTAAACAAFAVAPVFAAEITLPEGHAPAPLAATHFPSRLHAFVWRNWSLVPAERLAETVGATREQIVEIGAAMGLTAGRISEDQQRRSYLSVIRRNWHLLPYDQLLKLLAWTPEQLAFTLREDDFLFVKLGSLKPRCEPLKFVAPDESSIRRTRESVWLQAVLHKLAQTDDEWLDGACYLSMEALREQSKVQLPLAALKDGEPRFPKPLL